MTKIYSVPYFEYGYIKKPSDMYGTLTPFRPCWWVQYLGDGQSKLFDTKKQCLQWIKEWDED